MKELDKIREEIGFELYSIDTISKDNNLIFVDTKNNVTYKETNLIRIFDMLREKNYMQLYEVSKIFESAERFPLTKDEEIKFELIMNQKSHFKHFKNFILCYKKSVYGYIFRPINERIIEMDNKKYFNVFESKRDFSHIKPIGKKQFPHIDLLLKNILQELYEHFMKFIAYKLVKPLDNIPRHYIIVDDGGTGKTQILAEEILPYLFDIIIINQQMLDNNHNEYMENTTLVIAEEIDNFESSNRVKQLTTARKLSLNPKFKSAYTIDNYNNWIFFSNSLKPVHLDERDRRFNIVGGGKPIRPRSGDDWSETLFNNATECDNFFKGYKQELQKELDNLVAYLKFLGAKVKREEIDIIIPTKERDRTISMSVGSEPNFITEMEEIGLDQMFKDYSNKFSDIGEIIEKRDIDEHIYTCLKFSIFYDLYVDFCKKSNYRVTGKNKFSERIKNLKGFKQHFIERRILRDGGVSTMMLIIDIRKKNIIPKKIDEKIDVVDIKHNVEKK